ncbi:hypothetical protein [Novosphingobium guangzhouense]|uniref:Uncharacterized protein n=1 Tax=Novosphingobium guangzhouense TaxID=1850347 RepID=A0A2K2G231_9SPHN|nr:hypothetical protein [Novosphingobium guangzhouense]PNU05096.1 hypothetical protein A8V01_04545 [Novosphingobium guangzhouense]
MDVIVKYLRPNPKTGILEFRRTFPARLLPHVRDDSGKKISEVKRTLGVRVFDAGRDGSTYRELNELFERLAWKAGKAATGTFDAITKPLIAYFAEKVRSEGLELDEDVRFLRETIDVKTRRAKGLREACEADLKECRQLRALPDIDGMISSWKGVALELTQAHDRPRSPCSPRSGSGSRGRRVLRVPAGRRRRHVALLDGVPRSRAGLMP